MRITVVAVGNRMPAWVAEAVTDYCRRMPSELSVSWREIALAPRGKNPDIKRAIQTEGEQMLASVDARERVIALDVTGKAFSTEQLAEQLAAWQMDGRNVSLLIGGPDGLAPACSRRAESSWSLSALTLPHPLVRVVLAEQLYRAWSINANHPYHRQG